MAQDPRNPKTPKIKTDFRKPTKFQADMTKKLEKLSKNKKAKIPKGTPVPPKPTTSTVTKILNKMGPRGRAAAAVLAGVGIGVGGSSLMNKKPKATPKKVAAKPAAKPARRRGPSGPTMTSMGRPSTGPKPRNKDRRVKPRRPSGPSMTGFRK